MEKKRCAKCGYEYELKYFTKDMRKHGGYSAWCVYCAGLKIKKRGKK